MTLEEREAALKTGRVIRAARKQLGMTQVFLCRQLGISQSALSKMEHSSLIPSAHQWFEFCKLMNIPSDSLLSGTIERLRPASLEESPQVGGFKIPQKYALHRGSKIRAISPFLRYLRASLGERKTGEFFKALKVDPDYFVDIDNQINLDFILDIARLLVGKGLLKPRHLPRLTQSIDQMEVQGSLHYKYVASRDPIDLMQSLVGNSRLYECNFRYQIERQNVDMIEISINPEVHVRDFYYRDDDALGDFLCRYKKNYFQRFCLYGRAGTGKPGVKLREIECHYKNSPRCVYQISTQS